VKDVKVLSIHRKKDNRNKIFSQFRALSRYSRTLLMIYLLTCESVYMTDEDRRVDLLCCLPHCNTAESCLTNDTLTTFNSSSDSYDD